MLAVSCKWNPPTCTPLVLPKDTPLGLTPPTPTPTTNTRLPNTPPLPQCDTTLPRSATTHHPSDIMPHLWIIPPKPLVTRLPHHLPRNIPSMLPPSNTRHPHLLPHHTRLPPLLLHPHTKHPLLPRPPTPLARCHPHPHPTAIKRRINSCYY